MTERWNYKGIGFRPQLFIHPWEVTGEPLAYAELGYIQNFHRPGIQNFILRSSKPTYNSSSQFIYAKSHSVTAIHINTNLKSQALATCDLRLDARDSVSILLNTMM